jgi:hypothetical protein
MLVSYVGTVSTFRPSQPFVQQADCHTDHCWPAQACPFSNAAPLLTPHARQHHSNILCVSVERQAQH